MILKGHPGLLALVLASVSAPALAQEAASGDAPAPQAPPAPTVEGRQSYPAEDFARFSPKNALDMLNNLPSFQVRSDDGARGLGQANTNVLVNGQRLSAKSDSVFDQLSRIPAGSVVRIDVVDGASLNIPGLTGQVADVITRASAFSGQFSWQPNFRAHYAHPTFLGGEISGKGSLGKLDYTLALSNDTGRGAFGGAYRILNGDRSLQESRDGVLWSDVDRPKVSGTFKLNGPGTAVGNLNLSYRRVYHDYQEDEDRVPVIGSANNRLLRGRERNYDYEIGGDYAFPVFGARLKLIGLDRFEHAVFSEQAVFTYSDGSDPTGDRYAQAVDSGEYIARGELSWKLGKADWQLAAEGAFNRLAKDASLFDLGSDGAFVEQPFPEGDGEVTEDRYETILSYGQPLSRKLTLQLSAGAEYSRISSLTGGVMLTRQFVRPKGSANLAWSPRKGFDISLKVERSVGQLDFGDFLARVFLDQGNANASNNTLVPPQSWNIDLTVNRDFGKWGSGTLRLFERSTQDFVDIVPLPGGVEGRGNIDRVERHGLELNGTLKFDPLGFTGAKLDTHVILQKSDLKDPLPGEHRQLSYLTTRLLELNFRQDIPHSDWAYGAGIQYEHTQDYYRLGEFGHDWEGPVFDSLFVENKNVFGLTVHAEVINLLGARHYLQRTVYDGLRPNAPIAFIEDRNQTIGPIFRFEIKGNF
ncbi:MAG: TonB-dependent receptor plug domain-containing protein [Tsuneonella sp.]